MNRPRLNHDVLLHIASLADRNTLCVLTETCQLLSRHAARFLLEDAVSLKTDKQIMSFLHFVQRDRQHRVPHIHTLILFSHVKPSSLVLKRIGPALRLLFRHLSSPGGALRSLIMYRVERLVRANPELADLIASLETLEEIRASGVGQFSATMLQASRSHLQDAVLAIDLDEVDDEEDLREGWYPLPLLRNSQQSLQQLSIWYSLSAPAGLCFPNVDSLELTRVILPATQHYVRAFPNLRNLTMTDCGPPPIPPQIGLELELFFLNLTRNRREQESFGTWQELSRYEGSALMLYLMGILCPIRSLVIHDKDGSTGASVLYAVIEDARPERLALNLTFGGIFTEGLWEMFEQPTLSTVLAHLEFTVRLDGREGQDHQVITALENMIQVILPPLTSLLSFKLAVDCTPPRRVPRSISPLGEDRLSPFDTELNEWDLEGLACDCRRTNQSRSLKSIDISLFGHPTWGARRFELNPVHVSASVPLGEERAGKAGY
ncbi:hypothetical protein C8Q79DRAFT_17688 [Trametes meyenii]|nr:hypothetical protein C8Q79DRAFT_17688 [Trametes meyenii]